MVDLPFLHAVSVEEVDAFLERGDAVGDFREIGFAHRLLLFEVERRVIGRDGVDEAVAQPVPEDGLIAGVAQRRRHDVFRALELRPLGVGFVEREILDERLDADAHPALAGGDGLI